MSLDFLRCNKVFGVGFGQISLEVRISNHFRKVGASFRVAEKIFRKEYNEGLAEVTVDLTTKDVELQRREHHCW